MKRAGRIVAEIALTGFEAYGIAAVSDYRWVPGWIVMN